MIPGLVRKELRQLVPLMVALGALTLWSLADAFLLKAPDTHGWADSSWLLGPGQGKFSAMAELVLGVLIAYSLLPGEHDQRTIEFLYTLPVRRRTIFLVKFAVGWGLHATADLAGTAIALAQNALNPESFAGDLLRPRLLALQVAADLALPALCVAYGVLLSFFRRLGWVLLALVWLALEVAERSWPALGIFNVRAMLKVEHHGTEPIVPWHAWLVHGVMAAGALAVAARLWLARQDSFAAFCDRWRSRVGLRRAGTAVALLVAALLAGAVVGTRFDLVVSGDDGAADDPVRTFQTRKFRFTYRASREREAMLVVAEADRAYARVRRWLDAPEVDSVVADMTEVSHEHLGIAGWKKMRLDLTRLRSEGLLHHVLYHETTHVFDAALSQGAPDERRRDLRFFAEGLAEHVAHELVDRPLERAESRRIAALARSRYRLRFEDLLAPTQFLARHDEYLLYALGEVWAAALVDACGAAAPGKLLAAFGRADTPQTLTRGELWRHALQGLGCDLERVVGRFEQLLRRLEPDAARVPIATARLAGEEGSSLVFEVKVTAPTPGPWPTTILVRAGADTPRDQTRVHELTVPAGAPQRVLVPAPPGLGQRLEFQVGARERAESRPFFTRWQSATRP
jgi:hypothetical protein